MAIVAQDQLNLPMAQAEPHTLSNSVKLLLDLAGLLDSVVWGIFAKNETISIH